MQLLVWKLIGCMVMVFVISAGSIALVGALMAVAALREWYESRRNGE